MRILSPDELPEFARKITAHITDTAFSLENVGILRFLWAGMGGSAAGSCGKIIYELYDEDEFQDFIHDFVPHQDQYKWEKP